MLYNENTFNKYNKYQNILAFNEKKCQCPIKSDLENSKCGKFVNHTKSRLLERD